jgi:two-component system, OmpR family, response regulator
MTAPPDGSDALDINVAERRVRLGARTIELTPREWLLIEALVWRVGWVWGEPELEAFLAHGGVVSSRNAVRIHLCNIRRKLGWQAIQTLPGRGYRMVLPVRVAAV